MRKGDARREQIMATAETLFYQKGYEPVSYTHLTLPTNSRV